MELKKLDPFGQKNMVKAFLVQAGIKQSDIARRLRVSPTTVCLIVSGKKKSARVRREIARQLGMKVTELWPEREAA